MIAALALCMRVHMNVCVHTQVMSTYMNVCLLVACSAPEMQCHQCMKFHSVAGGSCQLKQEMCIKKCYL